MGILKTKSGLSDLLRSQLGAERPRHHDAEQDARDTAKLWVQLSQYVPMQGSSGETILGVREYVQGK